MHDERQGTGDHTEEQPQVDNLKQDSISNALEIATTNLDGSNPTTFRMGSHYSVSPTGKELSGGRLTLQRVGDGVYKVKLFSGTSIKPLIGENDLKVQIRMGDNEPSEPQDLTTQTEEAARMMFYQQDGKVVRVDGSIEGIEANFTLTFLNGIGQLEITRNPDRADPQERPAGLIIRPQEGSVLFDPGQTSLKSTVIRTILKAQLGLVSSPITT